MNIHGALPTPIFDTEWVLVLGCHLVHNGDLAVARSSCPRRRSDGKWFTDVIVSRLITRNFLNYTARSWYHLDE